MKLKNALYKLVLLLIVLITGCVSVLLCGCGTTEQPAQSTQQNVTSAQSGDSNVEVESVKLNKGKCSIKVGKTTKLKASVYPKNAEDTYIEWAADDTDIAIVNSEGLVTGKKAGVTNIIARASNGKEASCTIVVKKKKQTSQVSQNSQDVQVSPNSYSPFYGIWCNAAKDYASAQKAADKLINKGFDAEVFVTTDWSNLNSERWYVVSAGRFSTKESANAMLSSVKSVYSGAYVKYSGEWQG
jgi:hypothetical protein